MGKNLFAGIDPGQTGGIGIIDYRGNYEQAHRWNIKDPRALFNILYILKDRIFKVYIENVNLPTTGADVDNQYSAGANLLINAGMWRGWLIALNLEYCEIPPATWQAAHGLFRWKKRMTEPRAIGAPVIHSPLTLARSRWPRAPLEYKADDGKAVGLLLADLARVDHARMIDRKAIQEINRAQAKAKKAKKRQNTKIDPGFAIPW